MRTVVRTAWRPALSGLDGFLHFLPQPTTPPPEGAMALAWSYRAAYRPLLAPRELGATRA